MINRTRIKICGITRLQDAMDAASLGVDALGFVFVKSSPRWVNSSQALAIISKMPPFVQTVGLFMNNSEQEVTEILQATPLNLLQFHGDESPQYCSSFGLPYIKAIPMGGGVDPVAYANEHADAVGFLLDSHAKGESGGSGDAFNWDSVPNGIAKPLILAGGLNIENVASAVVQVKPYAVDVSSGVEASKGVKDLDKMAKFVRGVQQGDGSKGDSSAE